MPATRSADGVRHALEAAAATVQLSPVTAHQARTVMLGGRPDQGLIAGFLLGYRQRTRAAYLADLRDFRAWCANVGIGLSEVRRTHVEAYVRQLEQTGRESRHHGSAAGHPGWLVPLRGPGGCAPPLP